MDRLAGGFGVWDSHLYERGRLRNGQGIPPYQVYAFFISTVVVWFIAVLILSTLNPIILIIGIGAILYRIIEAMMRQRERDRLIASRRARESAFTAASRTTKMPSSAKTAAKNRIPTTQY